MKPARSFGYRDWCAQLQFAEPQAVQFGLVAGGAETGKVRGLRAEAGGQVAVRMRHAATVWSPAWPGKRVTLMLRPNNGAPIDFARKFERDFAGFHGVFDFLVGE